jgi:hypothetical protein
MKLIYLLILSLFLSCSKEDQRQVCGDLSEAGFTIKNFTQFYQNNYIAGDAIYTSGYKSYFPDTKPLLISWEVRVTLSNICNSDIPRVEFEVMLHNPDTFITVARSISEGSTNSVVGPMWTFDEKNFKNVTDYMFYDDFNGNSGSLTATIFFPILSKGNFSADSAYFFSNLKSMSYKITAHKPK